MGDNVFIFSDNRRRRINNGLYLSHYDYSKNVPRIHFRNHNKQIIENRMRHSHLLGSLPFAREERINPRKNSTNTVIGHRNNRL